MGKVSALERTSFLIRLLCLGTGFEDAAALGVHQTPPCISAAVGTEPIMQCRFPPIEENAIAYISWYSGREKLLPSDTHFRESKNLSAGSASLWIPRVQAEDAGVYICEVGNITCILKGNGTKLEVHGSGQTPENQTEAEGCIHVTVPHEDAAPVIVGLIFPLLILTLLIVCYFKWRKLFPAAENLRRRVDKHTEIPTQQETPEDPSELYSKPRRTTGVTHQEERHLQPQAPVIPNNDSMISRGPF